MRDRDRERQRKREKSPKIDKGERMDGGFAKDETTRGPS